VRLVKAPKMHFPFKVLHPQPTRFAQAGAHRRLSQRLSVGELEGPDVVGFIVGAGVGGRLGDGVGATDGIGDTGALVRQHELPHITDVSASLHALRASAMTASHRSSGQRFATHDTVEGPWVGMGVVGVLLVGDPLGSGVVGAAVGTVVGVAVQIGCSPM